MNQFLFCIFFSILFFYGQLKDQGFSNLKKKKTLPKNPLQFNIKDFNTSIQFSGRENAELSYQFSQYLFRLNLIDLQKGIYSYEYFLQNLFSDKPALVNNKFSYLNPSFQTGAGIDGLSFQQDLKIKLQGNIANRFFLNVDYNSNNDQSYYRFFYRGEEEDFIQSVELGEIKPSSFSSSQSQNFSPNQSPQQGVGLNVKAKSDAFTFDAYFQVQKSFYHEEIFNLDGEVEKQILDIDYIRQKYYQLPDKNINDLSFYEQITSKDEYYLATLIIDGKQNNNDLTLYFKKVSDEYFRLHEEEGIFEDNRPNKNQFAILFYNRYQNNQILSPSSHNRNTFLTEIQISKKPNTALLTVNNFVFINIPDSLKQEDKIVFLYERKNHYPLEKNILKNSLVVSIEDKNGNIIDNQIWRNGFRHRFQNYGNAFWDTTKNNIVFEEKEPFKKNSSYYSGFYEKTQNNYRDSHLLLRVRYKKNNTDFITLSHDNLVSSSLQLFLDDRLIDPKNYSVSGNRIIFRNKSIFSQSSKVRVAYRYTPFYQNQQKYNFNGNFNYAIAEQNFINGHFKLDWSQAENKAPYIGEEVQNKVELNLNSQFTLFKLLQLNSLENFWDFKINANLNMKVTDSNIKNKAILDDSSREISFFNVPLTSSRFYFAANPFLEESGYQLSEIKYIDFSRYNKILSGYRSYIDFSYQNEKIMRENKQDGVVFYPLNINFFSFEEKAGPFNLYNEGPLNQYFFFNQNSLVLDYDFSEEEIKTNYVSIQSKISDEAVYFKNFSSLEIIYKITPSYNEDKKDLQIPSQVFFNIDVGNLNEDLDLDNILDREINKNLPEGFSFNYANQNNKKINTRIGGYQVAWQKNNGNGVLDTEDKNDNGILDFRNENRFNFPKDLTKENYYVLYSADFLKKQSLQKSIFTTNDIQYEVIENFNSSDDPYQKENYIRMLIPLSKIQEQVDIVSDVNDLRFNLIEDKNETVKKARLILNKITFKGNDWNFPIVDSQVITNGNQISLSSLNSLESQFFKQNHLGNAYKNVYEKLHGYNSATDFEKLSETTKTISYRLNGIAAVNSQEKDNGKKAIITIDRSQKIDMVNYKYLKMYLFAKEKSSDGKEIFLYRFGNDENNYYEIQIPMEVLFTEGQNIWYELVIHLQEFQGEKVFRLSKSFSEFNSSRNFFTTPSSLLAIEENSYNIEVKGNPYLYNISYFGTGVLLDDTQNINQNTYIEGEYWLDEIHLDGDQLSVVLNPNVNVSFRQKQKINFGLNIEKLSLSLNYQKRNPTSSSPFVFGNEDSFQINTSFLLEKFLFFSYHQSKSYSLSSLNEKLNPKFLQNFSHYGLQNFSITLNANERLSFLPLLTHSFHKSSREKYYIERRRGSIDSEENYLLKKKNIFNEKYSLRQSKNISFHKKINLKQSLELAWDSYAELGSEKDIVLDEIVFRQNDDFDLSLFLPIDINREKYTVLNEFNQDSFTNARIDSQLHKYFLQNSKSKSFKLNFNIYNISIDLGIENSDQIITSFNEIFGNEEIDQKRNIFFLESWLDFYWQNTLDITGQRKRQKQISFKNNYSLNFNYRNKISFFSLFDFSFFSFNFQYSYQESNPYSTTSDFNDISFFESLENRKEFEEIINKLKNFYNQTNDYKTIQNYFSLQLRSQLKFFKTLRMPFTLSRNLFISKQNVIDSYEILNNSELKEIIQQNDFQQIANFGDQYFFHGNENELFFLSQIKGRFSLPYVDLFFVSDFFLDLLQVFFPQNSLKESYRIEVANQLNKIIQYKKKVNDFIVTTSLLAHDQFYADINERENFLLNVYLPKIDWIELWLPQSFNFRSYLTTSQANYTVSQKMQRNFSFNKDNYFLLSKFPKSFLKNLSHSFHWQQDKDFRKKTMIDIFSYSLNSSVEIFSFLSPFQIEYRINSSSHRQYLLQKENGKNYPYLGIGNPSDKQENLGELENDISAIESLQKYNYNNFVHTVKASFFYQHFIPRKIIYFLPFEAKGQTEFSLQMNFFYFVLPDVNIDLFRQGKFNPEDQSNSLAQRALQNSFKNLPNSLNGKGSQISEALISFTVKNDYIFTDKFKIDISALFSLNGGVEANSYIAYAYRNIAVEQKDKFDKLSDEEKKNWLENYYLQNHFLRLDIAIKVGVEFIF